MAFAQPVHMQMLAFDPLRPLQKCLYLTCTQRPAIMTTRQEENVWLVSKQRTLKNETHTHTNIIRIGN